MFLQGFVKREADILLYIKNSLLRRQVQGLDFKLVETVDFDQNVSLVPWQRKISKGSFFHAPHEGIGRSGAAAMSLKDSHKDMTYVQEFKARPGLVYRVTVDVRTVGVDQSCVVGLRAAWSAPGKTWLNSAYDAREELTEDASFDWRKLSVVVSSPDVDKCKLKVLLSSAQSTDGEVFFDNLTIEEALPAK